MVSKLEIQTGICSQVFNLLKKEVAEWNDKKKWCSIIFDEMSLIDTALTYDKNKDEIKGFVELQERKNNFADHALVFMVRGVRGIYKWQQPIAFYYCSVKLHISSEVQLKQILKEVVAAVEGCGL
ncbi:uncharacterized protein LOC121726003 [Aricia agestis]|uniref:uncharacterized protein LOC121726003 n=1 Tax=Aricia agestis TaxID=91739 RepID=UPI001C202F73|nr:uncharacterized protein LOC121726003 [Aricia agestis]